MALAAGSIDISDPENVTGTGLSFAMFGAMIAGVPVEHRSALATASMKAYYEGQAAAIIDYVKANAEIVVVVHTGDAGLQRLPATFVANADTQGPSTDKNLSGTIT